MSGVVMPIVRVAVLAENRLTEMALPAEVPLREILPAVQRLAAPVSDDDGDAGAPVRLSLAPIGGAPFSLDASLDTVGVVDGDLLALQPLPPGPAAPGIVEDIADAAVIFSAARLRPWGAANIQRGALAAAVGFIVAATTLAVTHRLATGEPLGRYAASVIAVLTVLASLVSGVRSPRAGVTLSAAALVPIAAACALAVPGGLGPANIMLGAAGFSAWSVVSIALPRRDDERAIGFFTATAVLGAGVLLAAGAASLWRLSLVSLGCGLIVAGLLLVIEAAQLSALWARFPLPVIPAPGDPTPSAPSLRVLEDLPRRVRISDAHQVGFIAGGVLLSVLGSTAIAARPETVGGWGWYVVAAAALGAVLRARVWDSAACKAWLLAQPYLTVVALLALYAATARYSAALWTLAVLAGLVLAWVIVALSPTIASPDSYSLPIRRLVGFLAAGIDGSLIPVMAYVVGLYGWLLNR
ncbi:type VII secretion integral membrane protein EccD [Mycobacterium sp. SM1]|nr:type VII secretion integral membrane protein EccD [Mycobacterium sp. SM1]